MHEWSECALVISFLLAQANAYGTICTASNEIRSIFLQKMNRRGFSKTHQRQRKKILITSRRFSSVLRVFFSLFIAFDVADLCFINFHPFVTGAMRRFISLTRSVSRWVKMGKFNWDIDARIRENKEYHFCQQGNLTTDHPRRNWQPCEHEHIVINLYFQRTLQCRMMTTVWKTSTNNKMQIY